jgi:hypothetical protein
MSTNLPPGVTVNMIPGNRPEDLMWERMVDRVYLMTVTELHDKLTAERAAMLDTWIHELADKRMDDAAHDDSED